MKGWRDIQIRQDAKGRLIKDVPTPIVKHKFSAKPQVINDLWFGSKLEARYYELLKRDENTLFFLRQVPFHLPEKEVYRCDFMVFKKDGTVHFIDVKGYKTRDFMRKKALVERYYPVIIEIVKRSKLW